MRGLQHLHPQMRLKAEQLKKLCAQRGLPLLITETLRTVSEQNDLYAQGRTKSGQIVTRASGTTYQSPHQWGVAFDFCRNVKGREYDNGDGFFNAVGALGKSIGLFWGGDFKSFTDMPHLEMPEFLPSNSTAALIREYGTPEIFMERWDD